VEDRELTDANAIFLAADRGARIIGPTLGGFAMAAVGGVNAMSRMRPPVTNRPLRRVSDVMTGR
jgi:hypothetical protein